MFCIKKVISLPACTDVYASFSSGSCTGTVAPKTYCIDNITNKIYPVTDVNTGACSPALEAGLYVFKVEKDESKSYVEVTEVKLTADNTNISSYNDKVVLYNCDETQCKQTSGYIKDKENNIYTVAITGGAVETDGGNKVRACNAGSTDQTGNLNVGSDTDFKLCISSSKAVETDGNVYRIAELTATNIFTGVNTNKFITIKTQTNIFAWDNIAEGKYLLKIIYNKLRKKW